MPNPSYRPKRPRATRSYHWGATLSQIIRRVSSGVNPFDPKTDRNPSRYEPRSANDLLRKRLDGVPYCERLSCCILVNEDKRRGENDAGEIPYGSHSGETGGEVLAIITSPRGGEERLFGITSKREG